jgi:hypothetical protein
MTIQKAATAIAVMAATVIAAAGGQNPPGQAQTPPPIALDEVKLPAGFKIDVFAEGVTSARRQDHRERADPAQRHRVQGRIALRRGRHADPSLRRY